MSFLQLTQAGYVNNGYKLDAAIIEWKCVNGSFDRGSSYYQINVEVLKDKDCINHEKNILLEFQNFKWIVEIN